MGERIKGFGYIADGNSRVLILGSMPSVKSLEAAEYYAHPQNRFWRVMFSLFGQEFSIDYGKRVKLLKENGVALWDVIGECERDGSGDAAIRAEKVNDIRALLSRYKGITRVGANGGKAAETLGRFFPEIEFTRLPSTSPANAAVSLQKLIEAYSEFLF